MKLVPHKASRWETFLSWAYLVICTIIWLALIVASIHLIAYYVHQVRMQGWYDQEAMKMGIYIIGGAFLFLFIYRDHVKKIFKVKTVTARKNADATTEYEAKKE